MSVVRVTIGAFALKNIANFTGDFAATQDGGTSVGIAQVAPGMHERKTATRNDELGCEE